MLLCRDAGFAETLMEGLVALNVAATATMSVIETSRELLISCITQWERLQVRIASHSFQSSVIHEMSEPCAYLFRAMRTTLTRSRLALIKVIQWQNC